MKNQNPRCADVACGQNTLVLQIVVILVSFFHLSVFANRLTSRGVKLVLLPFSFGVSICTAQVSASLDCREPPLAFRADIRSPDAWEMAWEARWPETSDALSTWRNEQFELLVEMWRHAAPILPRLKREALDAGVPESAAALLWWSTLNNPFGPDAGRREAKELDDQLLSLQAEEAMAWGHAQSQSTLPLDDWACAVRTGMRLFENFDLPEVHVVCEGETVYSIARTWNVSPICLSVKNDVWDDIQPGMTLLIPQLLD